MRNSPATGTKRGSQSDQPPDPASRTVRIPACCSAPLGLWQHGTLPRGAGEYSGEAHFFFHALGDKYPYLHIPVHCLLPYKEGLFPVTVEADKSPGLQSANWRCRRADVSA